MFGIVWLDLAVVVGTQAVVVGTQSVGTSFFGNHHLVGTTLAEESGSH